MTRSGPILAAVLALLGLGGCTIGSPSDGGQAKDSATTTIGESTAADPSAATTRSTIPSTRRGSPEPGPQRPEVDAFVTVFLFCGPGVVPVDLHAVERVVPADGAPLRAAMTQLLLGVTPAEEAKGLQSAFSSYTAGRLLGVNLEAGVATLNFTSGFVETNNFSTANLSGVGFSQIDATVFQFPGVQGIELEVEGERWCGWEATCEDTAFPLRTRR